jgi:hypothetical protein
VLVRVRQEVQELLWETHVALTARFEDRLGLVRAVKPCASGAPLRGLTARSARALGYHAEISGSQTSL